MSEEKESLQHHRRPFGTIEGTLAAIAEGTSDCIGCCRSGSNGGLDCGAWFPVKTMGIARSGGSTPAIWHERTSQLRRPSYSRR